MASNNRLSILVALDGTDDGLKRAIGDAEKSFEDFTNSAKETGEKVSQSVADIQSQVTAFNERVTTLRNQILATFGVAWAADKAAELVQLGDEWNQLASRVKLATTSQDEYVAAQQGLFEVAQETRSDLESTVNLYVRTQQAVKNLGGSQQDALDLTRTIAEAFKVSGASAEESSAGITQLSQALGSGVLRGDEFNSVMESSPRLAQALADGLGAPISQLRAMAEQGELTADKVVSALLSQKDKLAAEYAQMPVTVADATTQAQNALLKYVGELNQTLGATQAVAGAVQTVAAHMDDLGTGAGVLAGVLAGQGVKAMAGYAAGAAETARALLAQKAAQAEAQAATLQSLATAAESARQTAADAEARVGLTRKLVDQAQAEVDLAAKKTAGSLGSASAMAVEQEAVGKLEAAQGKYRVAVTEANTASDAAVTAHGKHQDALAGTAAKTTVAEKALGALNGAVNVLQAGFVGFEIGQFLTRFELVRQAGSYVAEAFSTVLLGADQLQRFLNGSLTWDQAIAEGRKLHAEYDEVRKGLTDTAQDGEAAHKKLTESQAALTEAMKPLQSGLAGVSAESRITDKTLEDLRLKMEAARQAADDKTAALGRAQAGTADYTQAQNAAKEANAAATVAVTQYTQALAKAVEQRDSELKVAKDLTEQLNAEHDIRQQALQAQIASAKASGDELQALKLLGDAKAAEVAYSATLVAAKQTESDAAAAHVKALEAQAAATGGVSDKEREGIESAKASALAAKEAAEGARQHYEALSKLPASLDAVKTEQALTTDQVARYKQAAEDAIAATGKADAAYKAGKLSAEDLAKVHAEASGKLETYTQALAVHVQQLEAAEAAAGRETTKVGQAYDVRISQVQALQAVAKARGDEATAAQLGIDLLILEAQKAAALADAKQKEHEAMLQTIAAKQAEAEADGTLTAAEQAAIQTSKDAAEATRAEADQSKANAAQKAAEADAAERVAEASKKETEQKKENTVAAKDQAEAQKETNAQFDYTETLLITGAKALEAYNWIIRAGSDNWTMYRAALKLSQDQQDELARANALQTMLEEAAESGRGLIDVLRRAGVSTGNLDDAASDATDAFRLLDEQQLSGLKSAVQSVTQEVQSLRDAAEDAMNAALLARAQTFGNAEQAENLRWAQEKADLEQQIDKARTLGDPESVRKLETALKAREDIHQKNLADIKKANAKATGGRVRQGEKVVVGEFGEETFVGDDGRVLKIGTTGPGDFVAPSDGRILPHGKSATAQAQDDREGQQAAAPRRAGSAPARTIRVELAAGPKAVAATVDARDEGRLLELLKEAQSRAS